MIKGKIIQYVVTEHYQAVLTDEGNIYERRTVPIQTELAPAHRKIGWTVWKLKDYHFAN